MFKLWKFYVLQVMCNIGPLKIRVFTATKHATMSLLIHLRRGHSGEAPEIVPKISKLTTAPNQSTIDFGKIFAVKNRKFENLLKKFIIHKDLPLLLVESQSLRNFVRNWNGRIHIPSRKSLKDDIMNEY